MQQQLAHYRIEETLGEGSFAWVYRAYDEKFEQYVALKILKTKWLDDPNIIARFKQEARAIRKLRHPHIIDVYDVGETDGEVYLAQLLVEGETLAQRLAHGPLMWDEVLKITTDIGSALDYAHKQGIIHRDIKPQNILLDKENQAYLGDFGLMRVMEGSTHFSSTTSMVGTAHYMAPEVWDGQKAIPASDIYALSCVVFEILTGKVLFEGSSMAAVTKQHIVGPQFPESWPGNVPEGVAGVLQQGLTENPVERLSSAGELATLLIDLRSPVNSAPAPPVVPSTKPDTPTFTAEDSAKSNPPWLLIGGAVIVVLVIAAVVIFVLGKGDDTADGVAVVATPTTSTAQVTVEPVINATATKNELVESDNTSSQELFVRWSCKNTYTIEAGRPIDLEYGVFVARGIDLLENNLSHLRVTLSMDGQSINGIQGSPSPISSIPCGETYSDEAYWVSYETQLNPLDPGEYKLDITYFLDEEITNGYDLDGDGKSDNYGPGEIAKQQHTIIVK